MKFTDIFVRRPVLALVVNLLVIIAGLQAIWTLNVRQYPRSDNAVVTVETVYVGASVDLVRGFTLILCGGFLPAGRQVCPKNKATHINELPRLI